MFERGIEQVSHLVVTSQNVSKERSDQQNDQIVNDASKWKARSDADQHMWYCILYFLCALYFWWS